MARGGLSNVMKKRFYQEKRFEKLSDAWRLRVLSFVADSVEAILRPG